MLTVQIKMANGKDVIPVSIDDLRMAIDHCKYALYVRHRITLIHRFAVNMANSREVTFFEVDLKGGKGRNDVDGPLFRIGQHLRGISLYLLKHHPELEKYKVGTRLFSYTIYTGEEEENYV